MPVIKQISVYDGNSWGEPCDIGADASNILLSSNIAGNTNLQIALSNILPASQLPPNTVIVTDGNKQLYKSEISAITLNTALRGASTTVSLQSQIDTLNNTTITGIQNTLNENLTIVKHGYISNFFTVNTNVVNEVQGSVITLGKIVILSGFGFDLKKNLSSQSNSSGIIAQLPSNSPFKPTPNSVYRTIFSAAASADNQSGFVRYGGISTTSNPNGVIYINHPENQSEARYTFGDIWYIRA